MTRLIAITCFVALLFGGTSQAQTQKKRKIPPFVMQILKSTPEQFIKRFDKNKDDSLSENEVPRFLKKAFDRSDADGNNKLDRQEVGKMLEGVRRFLARMQGQPKATPKKRNPKIEQVVAGLLKKYDKNNDGKDTKKEVAGERLERAFKFVDADKNGYLDKTELTRIASRFVQGGGNRGQQGQRTANQADFDALDADADGRVTRSEAGTSSLGRNFAEIDSDKDGKLSRREYETYLRKKSG